jgi:quercetin dioxygenase-like cupin family protein
LHLEPKKVKQAYIMAHIGALPKIRRYITTHNAVFSKAFNEESKMKANDDGIAFALSFTTKGFPVDMNDDKDLDVYGEYLQSPPGLVVSGGTVLRHVDIPPDTACTMHRTVSLDYGCVLEGEVDCLLDSGEKRTMKRGDVAIQRGTIHQWINHSKTEWTRMLFVLQECKPLTIAGEKFGENLAGMAGVRSSD